MSRGLLVVLLAAFIVAIHPAAVAETTTCDAANLLDFSCSQTSPGSVVDVAAPDQPTDHVPVLTYELYCGNAPSPCDPPRTCSTPAGGGVWYYQLTDGVRGALTCQSVPQPTAPGPAVTPGQVRTAWKHLAWDAPTLTVQPPGGRTLVNLPTVLSSDATTAQTRTTTLLGRRVTITATPIRWTWQPGAGMPPWTTTTSGRPWHDGDDASRLNQIQYRRHGTALASVAVTYAGTYTVDGGPPQSVPGTLTLTSPPQQVTILTATPHLTG